MRDNPAGPSPTTHCVRADFADRVLAERAAAALESSLAITPDALTLFAESSRPESAERIWRIEAYFAERPDPAGLGRALADALGEPVPAFVERALPPLNWVAVSQAALPPVTAGRFCIYGSHDRARVPQGPHAILIDAGLAFGTAHHATTRGCLAAIDRLTRCARRQPARALDVGCGSGILSIALARALPSARIVAVDIDAQSVAVAQENAAANRVGARIRAVVGTGVEAPAVRAAAAYDLVVANILAAPLIAIAGRLRGVLVTGGDLVLSGLLTHEAARVAAAYRAHGFVLRTHDREAGWSTLTLTNGAVARRRRDG